jgi:hypothetical protein
LAVTSTTQGLRIVVTGLIAQHPSLGGVAWDYAQYAAGLHRLGHDVYYLEDSGEWPYTLDGGPSGNDWIAHDCTPNVRHLASVMERFGLADRWAYRFPIKPRWFGMSHAKRLDILRSADLLINVSGSLKRPSDYRSVRRLAYIDSDPVFTQIKIALPRGYLKFQKRVSAHDVYFSFGEQSSKAVAATPYMWQPTRQPILLSDWSRSGEPRPAYTTIMNWASYRPVRYRGQCYGQKDVEFRRFVGLPAQVPDVSFEVALSSTSHTVWETGDGPDRSGSTGPDCRPRCVPAADLMTIAGWDVVDAGATCSDLDCYRSYIQRSRAEWSVAKNGYVKGRSGWFSCRSACYLAAGRPVVVQDTGFSRVIPTGTGVLAFNTLEEATAAVTEVEAHYDRHAKAAREIAATYFDSDKVLMDLVEHAMTADSPTPLAAVAG